MKPLRLLTVIALALLCGTVLGIGLQRYLSVAGRGDRTEAQLASPVIAERLQGRLKLYVLIRDSRTWWGRRKFPADIATSANIFTFGNDYRWQVARPPIDSPQNQVDVVSLDESAGFGPAMPFAQSLIEENNNQIIGLIPCAKNGSSITEWQKSPSDSTTVWILLEASAGSLTHGNCQRHYFLSGGSRRYRSAAVPVTDTRCSGLCREICDLCIQLSNRYWPGRLAVYIRAARVSPTIWKAYPTGEIFSSSSKTCKSLTG